MLQTSHYCAPLLGSEVVAPHVNTNARGLADLTFTQSDRFVSPLGHEALGHEASCSCGRGTPLWKYNGTAGPQVYSIIVK